MFSGEKIMERLSPAGISILVAGVLIGYLADHIARRFFTRQAEQSAVIIRVVGLGLAVVGALMLLDFI